MKQVQKKIYMVTLVLLIGCRFAKADVVLPALISDNMVLQRDVSVQIWGWADQGERVTVEFNNKRKSTVTGPDRCWKVRLDPVKASGPFEMTVTGKNRIVVYDILVGEVWVCSGQSNMHWPVKFSADAEKEIAAGNHPDIRLFYVKNQGTAEPAGDFTGHWEECTSRSIVDFSAAAYFFGRELMNKLDVPVGLIQSSWGGTSAEAWTSLESLRENSELKQTFKGWEEILAEKPKEILDHYELMSAWFVYAFECMGQKESYQPIPKPPEEYKKGFGVPSWLYNGMIAPLTPFAIKGVIWYQGESNTGRAYQYRALFPTLIRDWRKQWGIGEFPFLFVQLSNARARETEPSESAWSELREAQLITLEVPNTAMAVTIDLGEADDVHYKNKQEVGRRLSLGALKLAYGGDIVHSGPLYDSMEIRVGRVYIRFKLGKSALVTSDGGPLKGFAVAGTDSVFVWADAKIEGDNVVVWSDDVPDPAAVRYAWGNNPECNLYNKAGLPASPFRTDDWPGITQKK